MADRLIFLDTETTDIIDGSLIELAYGTPGEITHFRVKPPVRIEIEAMAVHHITPSMVESCQKFQDRKDFGHIRILLEENVVVAHNAPFDIGVLKREGIFIKNFINTQRVARHLYPELPKHSLQYLRYYFECYLSQESVAHSADGDVRVLMAVFEKLLEKAGSLEEVIELNKKPALLLTISFGKHAGRAFSDINRTDRNYIEYLHKQDMKDRGEDFLHTVKYWMGLHSR